MSEKEDEIVIDDRADFLIDTQAITRTTTKMHRVRWTIENVSQLPLETMIIGSDFNPTTSSSCNISFKKTRSDIFVYLKNISAGSIKIERSLALFGEEGKLLHIEKMGEVYTLETNKDVDIIGRVKEISRFDSLNADILIIDCRLKIEGQITTAKGFSKYERKSRDVLVNDLKALINNPIDSDFSLRFPDEVLYTHKAILRARSTYFKKMFETKMKESSENFVSITDVSYPVMQKLVEFLYTEDFTETLEDNNFEEISDVYFAADKYEVMELRNLCAQKLISSATADNICQILLLAHRHSDEDLKILSMVFLTYHFNVVQKSNSWKTFICNEVALVSEVFSFCLNRLSL